MYSLRTGKNKGMPASSGNPKYNNKNKRIKVNKDK